MFLWSALKTRNANSKILDNPKITKDQLQSRSWAGAHNLRLPSRDRAIALTIIRISDFAARLVAGLWRNGFRSGRSGFWLVGLEFLFQPID